MRSEFGIEGGQEWRRSLRRVQIRTTTGRPEVPGGSLYLENFRGLRGWEGLLSLLAGEEGGR